MRKHYFADTAVCEKHNTIMHTPTSTSWGHKQMTHSKSLAKTETTKSLRTKYKVRYEKNLHNCTIQQVLFQHLQTSQTVKDTIISNASFCSPSSYSRSPYVSGSFAATGYTVSLWICRQSQGRGKLDLEPIHLSIRASVPSCIL